MFPKDIYIIDPLGSSDADDAFSITTENNKDVLWVFIADPTKHFQIFDDTFNQMIDRCSTKYYYHKEPLHLFKNDILSSSNLKTNLQVVNCIAFKIYIDKISSDNFYEINFMKIKPNIILNYETASIDSVLERGIKISDKLRQKRISYIKEIRHNINYPRLIDNKWILQKDSETCINLKNMIAEFAIIVNKIIASELESELNIFRSCETDADLINCKSGSDMINSIIKKGITAQYEVNKNKHLLIDNQLYTHFTSPLRRASDCISHFIFKSKINKLKCPFEKDWLDKISTELSSKTRKDKKRYYKDTKYFTLLALRNMKTPIKCNFKFISIFQDYSNFILNKIFSDRQEYNVQMSITLKRTYLKEDFSLNLNIIYPEQKFDSEIFPELKAYQIK